MLRQRVTTAIGLLLLLAGTLAIEAEWPFLVLLALACGCTTWEWLRLTLPIALRAWGAPIGGVGVFGLCAGLVQAWTGFDSVFGRGAPVIWVDGLLFMVAAVWLLVALPAVVRGRIAGCSASLGWSLFGVAAPLAAWLALAIMVLQWSAWFAVSLLITVWVADVAAYFVGKFSGRHKLAPRVSPGKTWEGAAAGVLGALAWLGLSAVAGSGTFGHMVLERLGIAGAVLIFVMLGAISIVGDLFESLLKRRAHQKDSSQLLPGHGGVYDRIDAILPVAVCAMVVLIISAIAGAA
jgi:phosphatidate cytidylyltransferase